MIQELILYPSSLPLLYLYIANATPNKAKRKETANSNIRSFLLKTICSNTTLIAKWEENRTMMRKRNNSSMGTLISSP